MSRKIAVNDLDMDDIDKLCLALELDENKCYLLRSAVIEYCGSRTRGGRRGLSEYQQFISKCMKEKKIKRFEDASQAMKECAGEWREKKKRS